GGRLIANVTDEATGSITSVPLDDSIERAVGITTVSGTSKSVILGATNNGVVVTVVDGKGRVHRSFGTAAAAVSDDGQLVCYQQYIPPGTTSPVVRYGVFSAVSGRGAPDDGAAPLIPPDAATHSRASDFFWVTDRVVVFLDHTHGKVSVVGIEFDDG